MNRKQRRIAQTQDKNTPTILFGGRPYGMEEAGALALRESNLGNYTAALDIYNLLLAKFPNHAGIYNNLGDALQCLGRYDEALTHCDKAIALTPDFAVAHNNRGNILQRLKRYNEALGSFDKAIMLKPTFAEAYNNLGNTFQELKRYTEALAYYEKAISLKPDFVVAYNNRGAVFQLMKQYDKALADYDKVIMSNPQDGRAYCNKGSIFHELQQFEVAFVNYEKALEFKSDSPYLIGGYIYAKMMLSHWSGIEQAWGMLADGIEAGRPVSSPFSVLATPLSAMQQMQCAKIYTQKKFPAKSVPLWSGEKYSHDRIRIGYFSSDLRNHALSHLMAEFFELHDRSTFEVTAFSFSAPSDHPMRKRMENAFERFIDVSTQSDAQVAALARSMEIDIAVDLNGYTGNSRTEIFAMRPAPVQVSYMGYPGTMGAEYIDYLVADSTVIPEEAKCFYTETIAYLPDSYWVIDSSKKTSEKNFTRQEMGLPEKGFVFCCFNNNFKITPDVFDVWMRLLQKVDGSVLWLFEGNPISAKNLCSEAKLRGIAEHRLVFAKRMDMADHVVRHRLADLFLDTFYYNAHTTASDALLEGLPVVTCIGEAFAGRVAASILNAAGLPELITHSHADYEALALELATHPEKLSAVRQKLAQNRASCPLFNTTLFTKHFEDAFVKMQERSIAGLRPADIAVRAMKV